MLPSRPTAALIFLIEAKDRIFYKNENYQTRRAILRIETQYSPFFRNRTWNMKKYNQFLYYLKYNSSSTLLFNALAVEFPLEPAGLVLPYPVRAILLSATPLPVK